jgi:hypothetical protein
MRVVDYADVLNRKSIDQLSVITYLYQIRDHFENNNNNSFSPTHQSTLKPLPQPQQPQQTTLSVLVETSNLLHNSNPFEQEENNSQQHLSNPFDSDDEDENNNETQTNLNTPGSVQGGSETKKDKKSREKSKKVNLPKEYKA